MLSISSKKYSFFFFLILYLLTPIVRASDGSREQEYARLLQQNPIQGKIIWLETDHQPFLSILSDSEKTNIKDTAIIVHDFGSYPDQKPVIYNLRTQLPVHGWVTLTLQMPLRESNAEQADYYPLFTEAEQRILAAITYVKQQGAKNIVLIGYGIGALMIVDTVNQNLGVVSGLITISLPVPKSDQPQAQTLNFIHNIALPFLDLYAESDLPDVLLTAELRRKAGKDNPVYWQAQIKGDNNSYQQESERLVKRVYSWLASSFQ